MSESVNIKKTTTLLFILRVSKFLLSILNLSVTAHFFGVSIEKDMWVLSSVVIATVVSCFWGPLNEIFRTKFVFIKEVEGNETARKKTASLVGFIIWFSLFLGGVILIFARPIAGLLTNGVDETGFELLYKLGILLIPTILISELSNICTSILNAYNVFYIPEIVNFFTSSLNIVALIILAPLLGIYALVVTTYIGGLSLLTVLVYYLHKKDIFIWDHILNISIKDVWQFVVFALPFFFPYFIGQLNVVSQNYLAGLLGDGNISIIDYSRTFAISVQSVLSSVLTTIMVPMLAKAYINKQQKDFNSILRDNLQICFLILGVSLAFLVGAAEPVCYFFFESDNVSKTALTSIIALTQAYGIALVGVLLYMIFSYVMLSSNRRKLYAAIGVLVQVFLFGLYVLMFKITNSLMSFPVCFGFCHLAAALLMFGIKKGIPHKEILLSLAKSSLAITFVICSVYLLCHNVHIGYSFVDLIMAGLLTFVLSPVLLWGHNISTKTVINRVLCKLK